MIGMSYKKFGRRSSRGRRCFRLNPRRFSIHRLRVKFLHLSNLLISRCRCLCEQTLESIRHGGCGCGGPRRKPAVPNARLRSFQRSNSFYSEAIADCLEFIKRSSVSSDEYKPVNQMSNPIRDNPIR